ncbi:LysE family translocator [Leucobacter iarius]|uniref:LysE family translocator n=1 Tax=Leucobacter iarius TaxID=333963 RepID=A0ABN2LPC9_9MICO
MPATALTAADWLALAAAWIAAIAMPGPDLFLLLRLGIRDRSAALRAAIGIMLGNLAWILVSVLGLSALLRAIPWALPALQVAGSAVLIWIGVQSIRAGLRDLRDPAAAQTAGAPSTRPLRLGLITNLSNPKALLFFTALFSQMLPPEASWWDRGAIVALLVLIGLAWFCGFALAASARRFQNWFRRASPWIDMVAGTVFVLVAVAILTETALGLLR